MSFDSEANLEVTQQEVTWFSVNDRQKRDHDIYPGSWKLTDATVKLLYLTTMASITTETICIDEDKMVLRLKN